MMKRILLFAALCCSACVSTDDSDTAVEQSAYAAPAAIAKTLPDISRDLDQGHTTSLELVELYLERIDQLDRAGPELRSFISLNPHALDEARLRDRERQTSGTQLGALHGIPVVLKDNIESLDPMPTTAGAVALAANVTGRDSPLVSGLRDAGAIILGKANLSQWANFRSEQSISGWSALGGQVRNPHMLDRSPCGSSSGSAVAVAASLVAAGVGTETNGSIICPANVNGIVGFKPTVGLVSQQFIIPISASQDTAGPLTKSVEGAAMLMDAMQTGETQTDYRGALNAAALNGAKVGVLRFAEGSNPDITKAFNASLQVLKGAGATLVEIDSFDKTDGEFWDASYDVLLYEFKHGLNDYLQDTPSHIVPRTLEELIRFNSNIAEQELALFDQSIFNQAQERGALTDDAYLSAKAMVQRVTREEGIDALLATHEVDVLIAPSGPVASRIDPINGDVWPSWAGAGYMAAIAGYPHASVPMAQVHGVPVGLSFIGAKNDDAAVLSYAYAYEQRSRRRVDPRFYRTAEDLDDIGTAMQGTLE